MSLAAFLERVVRALRAADVPFMLTGSLAAAFYGQPRATQDIDLVIEVGPEQLQRLVEQLAGAGFYVSADAAGEALRHGGQFNAIDPEIGWKADLIIRKARDFSRSEFERRKSTELLGVEVALTSLEDLIIAKLEWSELGDSELQRRDIREILGGSPEPLDRSYLEDWIKRLGLEDAWRKVQP